MDSAGPASRLEGRNATSLVQESQDLGLESRQRETQSQKGVE